MKPAAIIVPAYNSAATIAQTLRSILSQDDLSGVRYVLLCDDASTDDTVAIARRTWNSELELRVSRLEANLGQWPNTNRGFRELDLDVQWAFILHADDVAKPTWLRTMLGTACAAEPLVASVCSSYDVMDESGGIHLGEDDEGRGVEVITGCRESARSTIARGCWWHISGGAIRLEAFKKIGAFRAQFPHYGDWEWILRCLTRGFAVAYIPRTLITYRLHSASISSETFRIHRDVQEALEIIREYAGYLSRMDLATIHGKRLNHLARRMLRSILDRHGERALLAVRVALSVVDNFVRCQARAGRGSQHPLGLL